MNDETFFIGQHIDDPKRYLGLTLDECIPLLGTVIVGFWMNVPVMGFVGAGLVWFSIRKLKKGQGPSWLTHWLYWHLPSVCFQGIYLKTPPSMYRHWLF